MKAFQDNLVPLIPKGVKKFMITDSPDQPIVHKEYFRLSIMQKCLDFILMKASREKNYKILFDEGVITLKNQELPSHVSDIILQKISNVGPLIRGNKVRFFESDKE